MSEKNEQQKDQQKQQQAQEQQQKKKMEAFMEESEAMARLLDGEIDPDDDLAEFRTLSEEEKKWALIQLQLDAEERYLNNNFLSE